MTAYFPPWAALPIAPTPGTQDSIIQPDPHGDMAETLLRHVPERRIDDVVYFNPDDLEYPIGLNLIELTKPWADVK